MSNQDIELTLEIQADEKIDVKELDSLTRQLRKELLLSGKVGDVTLTSEQNIPERAKAADALTLVGSLLITMTSSGLLAAFINVIQDWLKRHERRSITIKLGDDQVIINGTNPEEQRQLVNRWFERIDKGDNK